ncbi:Fibrinogen C domain-containing protein 1 [Mactra antiquata]
MYHYNTVFMCLVVASYNRFGPEHNGMAFSTFDHDVDQSGDNCASLYHGAWWFNDCYYASLNGQYLTPGTSDWKGIEYNSFIYHSSLKRTKMSFRRSRRL